MKLTQGTIQATREWFANNQMAQIDDVQSGRVKVNHPDAYFARCLQNRADVLAGKRDHGFTFQQRAAYIQTGEMLPFLPQ